MPAKAGISISTYFFYFHLREAFHQIQLDWRHEHAHYPGISLGNAPAFGLEPGTFEFSGVHFRGNQQLLDEPHLEFQEP